MRLVELAVPVVIGLGFTSFWHASLIMSMADQESSPSRNVSMVIASIIFVSNVSAMMWMLSAIGVFK